MGPMAQADLHCPNGCDDERFEALNAPLFVDRARRYLGHDDSQATFICARCGAVAIDLAEVGRAMQIEQEAATLVLRCPVCETEMLPPGDDDLAPIVECPACESRFAIEEGMPRLHGTGFDGDAGG